MYSLIKQKRAHAVVVAMVMLFGTAGCGPSSSSIDAPVSLAAMTFESASIQTLTHGTLPTVATDRTDDGVYMAYFAEEEGRTNILLAHRNPATGVWRNPVTVDVGNIAVNAHAQAPAQVVTGPGSAVYIAWTSSIPINGRRFDASNLYVSRSVDGGQTFLPPVAVNSDSGGIPSGHTFHDIAVASDGTIYVSWLDSRERAQAEAIAGKNGVGEVESAPAHSMSAHGKADMTTISGTQVWVAASHDGGATFTQGTTVARSTCQCCRTSLAIAPDGTVYVAWRHIFAGEQRDMAIAKSTDKAMTFSEPVRIHNDGWGFNGCPHSGPSIAVDSEGGLHAAWYTGMSTSPGLYYAYAARDLQFDEPTPLVQGVGVSQVKLAGNGSDVWVTWEDATNGSVSVGRSGTDGRLRVVSSKPGMKLPALAVVSNGIAIVGDGTDGLVGAFATLGER